MREALAAFLIIWLMFATFWPETVGNEIGAKAGEFMRSFERAYSVNKAND